MDLALVALSGAQLESDIVVEDGTWLTTPGLETAVKLSLFCNARAQPGDELPSGTGAFGENLGGYWGEAFLTDGGQFGSRLWTLKRSALTASVRQRARDFCLEALAWLIDLGIARDVRGRGGGTEDLGGLVERTGLGRGALGGWPLCL